MAHSSLIQVRVDDALKESAEKLFKDLGLDMPTAVRLFLKQSLLHNGIPFAVTGADPFYSDYNMQVLKKSIQQMDAGKTEKKTAAELEEMANE